MNKNISIALTAIGSAAAGTAIAMLLAPRKGKTTRGKLKKEVKRLRREVNELTGEARKQKKARKKAMETIERKKNKGHHVFPGEIPPGEEKVKDLTDTTPAHPPLSQATIKNRGNI